MRLLLLLLALPLAASVVVGCGNDAPPSRSLTAVQDSLYAAEVRISTLRSAIERDRTARTDTSRAATESSQRDTRARADSLSNDSLSAIRLAAERDALKAAQQNAGSRRPYALLGIGLAVLLALGAGGYWYTQRRDLPAVRTSVRTSSSRLPMTGAERTAQDIASGTATFYATSAQVDALGRQVEGQRRELEELRKWVTEDHTRREVQRATTMQAPVIQAPAPVALSPAAAAAAAFADWCRRATPMMSKVDFFANALAEGLPGTSVRAVYRDLNSQAEPVRFDGAGGASPAEFWLVTVGGEALVFPQPLNAHQFRDLTRIFEGTATPASLASITPARVRDEGAAFALVAPGRVSG